MKLARLNDAEGGKSRDRGASGRHTEDHPCKNVAEEMYAEAALNT